jgi:hypothetical protein
MRTAWLLVVAMTMSGCSLVGPSCLGRQQRGTVTAFEGQVAAGQTAVHIVPYGTEGSQNDIEIAWANQRDPAGPRLSVYATKVDCVAFVPPGSGPCAPVGSRGGIAPDGTFIQTSLIVTHGRGNPEVLGAPPQYKLWVIGDSARDVKYSIEVTFFFGPDC